MNILTLGVANLRRHSSGSLLTVLIMSLGVSMIVLSLLISQAVPNRLNGETARLDLIVAPQDSPVLLMLSTLFHTGAPQDRLSAKEVAFVQNHPMVEESALWQRLGHVQQRPLIATEASFFSMFGLRLADGRTLSQTREIVAGYGAARSLGLAVGSQLAGEDLEGLPLTGSLKVVGILEPSHRQLDHALYTLLNTATTSPQDTRPNARLHNRYQSMDIGLSDAKPSDNGPHALLVQYSSPAAANILPALVEARPNLIAVSPKDEVNRLLKVFRAGVDGVELAATLLVFISALGLIPTLFSALESRRYELALMRTLGASRSRLFLSIMLEGTLLSTVGTILGVALAHTLAELSGRFLETGQRLGLEGWIWLPNEYLVVAPALALGVIAALPAAIKAYRMNIANVLSTH